MTRTELIAELERLAHVFENHPIHSDMSATLRLAVKEIESPWAAIDDGPYEVIGTREAIEKAIIGIEPDASPFMEMINGLDWVLDEITPSPPSNGPLLRVPDDT